MNWTILRVVAEVLGAAGYCGLHVTVMPLVIALGASLRPIEKYSTVYYLAVGGSYLLNWGALCYALREQKVLGRDLTRQGLLDTWLAAFVAAFAVAAAMVVMKLPLNFDGWDGHGFGAMGGEANVVFFPWLHLGLWLLFSRFVPRRQNPSVSEG